MRVFIAVCVLAAGGATAAAAAPIVDCRQEARCLLIAGGTEPAKTIYCDTCDGLCQEGTDKCMGKCEGKSEGDRPACLDECATAKQLCLNMCSGVCEQR